MRKAVVFAMMLVVSVVATCLFLTACATILNHPPAPEQQQLIVRQFQLTENEARVHFFTGAGFNEAFEVYVNDVKVGLIGNPKEYIAIDLPPGTYAFTWMPISTGSSLFKPIPLQLTIANKELIFMRANWQDASSAATQFGAIGVAVGIKFATYFTPDVRLKDRLNEYTLILLNKDSKAVLSK